MHTNSALAPQYPTSSRNEMMPTRRPENDFSCRGSKMNVTVFMTVFIL